MALTFDDRETNILLFALRLTEAFMEETFSYDDAPDELIMPVSSYEDVKEGLGLDPLTLLGEETINDLCIKINCIPASRDGVVRAWSDGACSGNQRPGGQPGGWGAVLQFPDGHTVELSGHDDETTNMRMELTGALEAVAYIKRSGLNRAVVVCDARYISDGMNHWLPNWVKRGWKNSRGKTPENDDLWRRMYDLTKDMEIEWRWIEGHSGDPMNERADELATGAIRK